MGKRLKVTSKKFKNRVKSAAKKVLKVVVLLAVVYGIYMFGQLNANGHVYQNNETVREVIVEVSKKSEVMKRIAECESSTGHFAPSGQVAMNANSNGTVDVGKYQINTVWNEKASELGLNLTVEEDNEAFAMWIYENRGTGDWYSSRKCWQK